MTGTGRIAGRVKFGLVVIAILSPVLLGTLLFEHLLGSIWNSAFEKAGETLPAAGRLLLESRRPNSALSDKFAGEFGDNPVLEVTSYTARGLVLRVQRSLGVPARVYCFDGNGTLVYPKDDPDRNVRETLYAAISNYHAQRPYSQALRQLDIEGRRIFRHLYGESDFTKGVSPHGFDWECVHPSIPFRYINFSFCGRFKSSPNFGCLQVEVFASDLSELWKDAHCLKFRPESVPYAGIIEPLQQRVATESGLLWFPRERLFEVVASEQVVHFESGFLYKIRLPGKEPRTLVLALPLPFPLAIPAVWRWLSEFLVLALMGVGAWKMSSLIMGFRRLQIRLGWQIAGAFLFAALIPLVVLGYLGASRLIDIDDLQLLRWKGRMMDLHVSFDREFCNHLERLQAGCFHFARMLGQTPDRLLDSRKPPLSISSATTILYLDTTGGFYAPKDSGFLNSVDQSANRKNQGKQLRKILEDLFQQILADRGQVVESRQTTREKMKLTVQDILGDASPLLGMVKTVGRNAISDVNDTRYQSYFRLVETVKNRIVGFFLVIFSVQLETANFLNQAAARLVNESSPFKLIDIHPFYGSDIPEFMRTSLLSYVKKTIDTQTNYAFPFISNLGRAYFAATFNSSNLRSRYPVLVVPFDRLESEKTSLRRFIWGVFGLGILIILAVSLSLWHRVLAPLRSLRDAAQNITQGQFGIPLTVPTSDELGALAEAFNTMSRGLLERERMRRFVSQGALSDIRDELSGQGSGGQGRRVEVALLFSDIRGFTTLSETQPATEVVALLNDYFTAMDAAITGNGGEIRKLIGDAIMAVFHHLPGKPHPARRAVQAGMEMRRALYAFNRERSAGNKFTIENGIGIHFDQVVEGKIGAAGGRVDFAVMGAGVATASNLEAASRHGTWSRIIVSSRVGSLLESDVPLVPLAEAADNALEVAIRPGEQE